MANFGPADYNYDETISSLRYANRAKNIKNKAKINEDPKDALLRQFQKEIEALKRQLEEGGGGKPAELNINDLIWYICMYVCIPVRNTFLRASDWLPPKQHHKVERSFHVWKVREGFPGRVWPKTLKWVAVYSSVTFHING